MTFDLGASERELWAQMAAPWHRRRAWHEEALAPVTDWLLERLDAAAAGTVLELAAGNGETGLRAAQRLGPGTRAIVTDLSPEMVATARARGRELGVGNVEYHVMDAERLRLADASVDAVVCRCGYMLMPDRSAAMAETRRVLRPDGLLCLAVWAEAAANPFMTVPRSVLVARGHLDPDPGPAHMFALGSPERLAVLVVSAGFAPPHAERIPLCYRFADADALWDYVSEMAGHLAVALARATSAERAAVRRAIERQAAPFRDGAGYAFPAACLVVAAR